MVDFQPLTASLPSKEERRNLLERASVIWVDKNDLVWVIVANEQICIGACEDFPQIADYHIDERYKI